MKRSTTLIILLIISIICFARVFYVTPGTPITCNNVTYYCTYQTLRDTLFCNTDTIICICDTTLLNKSTKYGNK